jgi:hypothetical protein
MDRGKDTDSDRDMDTDTDQGRNKDRDTDTDTCLIPRKNLFSGVYQTEGNLYKGVIGTV